MDSVEVLAFLVGCTDIGATRISDWDGGDSLRLSSSPTSFMFVQLANRIWANCDAGVREFVLPNGEVIIVETALLSFDGVLLNENARPTFNLVLVANLSALDNVLKLTSLISTSNSWDVIDSNGFSVSVRQAFSAICLQRLRR